MPTQKDHEEAQRLLVEAGVPELAEQAKERTTPKVSTEQQEDFARQWGFATYLEMFETSKPVSSTDMHNWLVTNIGENRWLAWNEEKLRALQPADTQENAIAQVPGFKAAVKTNEPPPTG